MDELKKPIAIHVSSRPIRRLLRWLLVLISAVLVVVAVTFTGLRLALPHMTQYHHALSDWLSAEWGARVTYRSLTVNFAGYQPQLQITDLHLGPKGPVIPKLGFSLALGRSLLQGRLVAGKIVIDQPTVTLLQDANGQWALMGAPESTGSASNNTSWTQWLDRMPDLGNISIHDARINWIRSANPTTRQPARAMPVSLSVTARLAAHGWALSGALSAEDFGKQPVLLRAQGRLGNDPAAEVYISTRHWDLPAIQAAIRDFTHGQVRTELGGCAEQVVGLDCSEGMPLINTGALTGELWMQFARRGIQSVHAQFDATHLKVSRLARIAGYGAITELQSQAGLKKLSGQLAWLKTPTGWRLDVDRVVVETDDGNRLPTQSVHILHSGRETDYASDFADLNQLSVWLSTAPLPRSFLKFLGHNTVRGQARDIRLHFVDDHLDSGFLQLENFGNSHGQRLWPVIGQANDEGGLNLTLYKQPAGWLASINQSNLVLAVPGLFREPVTIKTLKGDLYWHDSAAPLIYSEGLTLTNNDLTSHSVFRYQAAELGDGASAHPAALQIDSHFDDIKVNRVPAYLPRNLLNKDILEWLDTRLDAKGQTGQVSQGHFVFNGNPAKFPFTNGGGWFSAVFNFAHLNLPYRPHWPALHDAAGSIAFVNKQFHTDISHGSVGDIPVAGARVSIFDLDRPVLDLAIQTQAPLADMLEFLKQTPLLPAGTLNAFHVRGRAGLDLGVRLAMYKAGTTVVKGTVNLMNNQFVLGKNVLTLERLRGPLGFTNSDFNARRLTAEFEGEPTTLSVSTPKKGQETVVSAQTTLDPVFALRRQPNAFTQAFLQRVTGKAPAEIQVTVPHHGSTVHVQAQSDLAGVASRLPEPLNKAADVHWPMTAALTVQDGVLRSINLQSKGARAWETSLTFNKSGDLAKGEVRNEASPKPPSGQLDISVHTPMFDWDRWQPILLTPVDRTADSAPMPTFDVHMMADRVIAAGQTFPKTRLDLQYADGRYDLQAKGAALVGRLRYTQEPNGPSAGQLSVQLSRLYLNGATATTPSTGTPSEAAWNLAQLPGLTLRVDDLRYDTNRLGRLFFDMKPVPGAEPRMDVNSIDWRPSATVSVVGNGQITGAGAQQQTRVELTALGKNVGSTWRAMAGASPIQQGDIEAAEFRFDWPGSPAAFSLGRLSGKGNFRLVNGQLNDVNPGVGRLAGLLSIGALARRLRLDFSDVVDQGLSFDTLSANWMLNRGEFQADPLTLQNASIKAVAHGRSALIGNTLDYTVKVYADVGMLLPIIGTVAGGPLVGGALLAIQQAIKSADKHPDPAFIYRITGTIDHPDIKTVNIRPEALP